jgi:glycerol uptake facilitator-like aquaporin
MFRACLLYIGLVVPLTLFTLVSEAGGSPGSYFLIGGYIAIAAVASCYRVTGGQLNPIVSLVNAFRKDKPEGFDAFTNLIYILAQFVGCAIGGALTWWFTTHKIDIKPDQGGKDATDYLISQNSGYTAFVAFVIGVAHIWQKKAFVMTLLYLTVTGKDTTPTKDTGMQAVIIGIAYEFLPL